MKRHSTSDTNRIEMTIAGITMINFPMMPLVKSKGKNAVTEVKIAKTTG